MHNVLTIYKSLMRRGLSLFLLLSCVMLCAGGKPDADTRWFLAGAADTASLENSAQREKQLVALLDSLCNESSKLAVESSELANEILAILPDSGVSPARAARLRLKIEEVCRQAGKVALKTESAKKTPAELLAKCRILTVDRNRGLVAIEAGSSSGAFKGMVFQTVSGEKVALTVLMTRPDISAAQVTAGNIDQLSPGMTVSAVEHRKK